MAVSIIFFLAFSFFVDDYNYANIKAKDVAKIEKILHRQQRNTADFVKRHLQHAIENNNFDECSCFDLQKNHLSLFITKNDSIVYWSDNLPVDQQQLNHIDTTEQYINIGNGWYVVQAYRQNQYKAITFILIRTEYTYQNNFLKNSFNPIFHFSENMLIAPAGSDEGTLVSGINGAPLFVITADVSPGQFRQSTLFRWIAVLLTLLLLTFIFYDWGKWNKGLQPLLIIFLLLGVIRLLIFFNAPFFTEGIRLFSPELYASSSCLKSLGDLIVHLLFIYIFVLLVYHNWEELKKHTDKLSSTSFLIYRFISVIIVSCVAWGVNYIATSLVLNSNISFEVYRISNLNVYSFIAYGAILLLLAILFLLVHLQTRLFANRGGKDSLILTQIIVFAFASIFFIDNPSNIDNYVFIFIFVIITILSVYNLSKIKPEFKYFTVIVVLLALYTTTMLFARMDEREQQRREVWAQSLSAERDPAAEMLLQENEEYITNDVYLRQILFSNYRTDKILFDYLIEQHFKGYFQNYDFQFQICEPNHDLYLLEENTYVNCVNFFYSERSQHGIPIQGSNHYWYMSNAGGQIHYHGEFKYTHPESGNSIFLFINLFVKPESESIGYPELLLDGKVKSSSSISNNYSYAKYFNGELINHSGPYDYSLKLNLQISRNTKNSYFVVINDYSHYVYKTNEGTVIIISRPKIRLIDIASLFSYNIVLIFIGLFYLMMFAGYPVDINLTKLSYKRKITYVLLASITASLTVLTITVLIFVIRQSDERNATSIQDKLRSVMIELEQSYLPITTNSPDVKRATNHILINLSNAFYTDINLYDKEGNLIATSRSEIFDKKLLGTKMNREAYKNLTVDYASKFIHWEQIGNMRYYSAYAPYYDNDNNILVYVNIPYFFKQSEFREEITQLIANIANIYILLILLGIALALFISNQLLRPLSEVQQKMGRLDLTHQPEKIDYKGNDEIGDLVREYNRMIGELAANAKKLATSERESAWREMARQIAHEIKNPLTPMRLNIQHVLRMKQNNVPGWEQKMEDLGKSLLEQINILSNIASEFSNFARINERERELIDLSDILQRSINLFKGYDDIEFDFTEEGSSKKMIMGNNDQLQRVFTNLIKNAEQALENTNGAKIKIVLTEKDDFYIISIEDNGPGISPESQKHLFQPNFTTKSSGTGLGLAISKNIVESFGGTIAFKEADTGGACFIIRFPISNIGLELLKKL